MKIWSFCEINLTQNLCTRHKNEKWQRTDLLRELIQKVIGILAKMIVKGEHL